MSDLGKDILSKASFAASLGLLIWFSISQFSHVVKDVKTNHGYCNVTKIIWMEKLCHEQDSITKILYEYYEPIVQGFFIEPQKEFEIYNVTVNGQIEYLDVFTKWSLAYNQLMLNRSVMPKTTDDKKLVTMLTFQQDKKKSTFDCWRYTNKTDAEAAIISEMKTIFRNDEIYITSEYRTKTYDTKTTWTYECWVYRTLEVTALMHHEYKSKWLAVPFVALLLASIGSVKLLSLYATPECLREFAKGVFEYLWLPLMALMIPYYVATFIFYSIVFECILQGIFKQSTMSNDEFWKKGGLFLPFVWLFKKIKTKVVQCYSRTAPSSDDPDINLRPAPLRFLSRSNNENNNNVDSNASRRRSVSVNEIAPQDTARTRRHSEPTVTINSTTPPLTPAPGPLDSVIFNSNLPPSYEPSMNPDLPPPTYDEAMGSKA